MTNERSLDSAGTPARTARIEVIDKPMASLNSVLYPRTTFSRRSFVKTPSSPNSLFYKLRFLERETERVLLNKLSLVDNEALDGGNSSPQPILGLWEYQTPGAVEDLVSDLLLVPGQAVHELPALLGTAALRKLVGDLIASEGFEALLGLGLLTHGHPGVGDEDIGIPDGLLGDVCLGQLSGTGDASRGGENDIAHARRDGVALRRCDGDVYAELDGADGEVEEDVIRVADPGDLEALEAEAGHDAERGVGFRGAGEGLVDGEEVGDRLQWVVVVREGVDDGDAGVLGEVGDFGVVAYAGDHAGGHGGDDDGGVVEGFVDLEEEWV